MRLGDVGQVLNGYAFKAELFAREGGMPLIRIRDVGSAASETFYSGDFDERYVVSAGDPIRPRLESHYAQKDFWTRAIGFTTITAGQPVGRVLAA